MKKILTKKRKKKKWRTRREKRGKKDGREGKTEEEVGEGKENCITHKRAKLFMMLGI